MALQKPLGFTNSKYFESPESLEGFEQVRTWLSYYCKKHIKSDSPTKESLSQLLISFIQFQETRFGKGARSATQPLTTPTTRLPMRCFYDFKPGGGLCHMFATMYRYKAEQRLEKFEFNLIETPCKDNDPNIKMTVEIEAKLIDVKCFRLPTVYIRPEVSDEVRDRITDILKRRQGEITEDEEEATHIIYPETETGENYARPSFKRGKNVMIHWYRMPESYDSWVANTFDLPDDIAENISPPQDVWRIAANWVLDLEEYNEWMAEKDYEVDEKGAMKVHRHRLSPEDMVYKKNVSAIKRNRGRSQSSISAKTPKTSTKTDAKTTTRVQKLPTTQCPDCEQTMTVKALKRHRIEKHGNETFECAFCGIHTKRKSALQDHQRRMHFERASIGRPRKNARKPQRKRSPFRSGVFETRHGTSIETLEKNSEMEKALSTMGSELEQTLEDRKKTEKRLTDLENSKRRKENETEKLKTRVTLLESRQREVELPSLSDIPSLLNFLNLDSSSSKEDMRASINLRLIEVSSQSNIGNEIYTSKKMTKEKKLQLATFYNEASDVLMKWFKKEANKSEK